MTTIAWDGKTLAADTQLTGGNRKLRSRKLWRIDRKGKSPLLYGFAGPAAMGLQVRDWLRGGLPLDDTPTVTDDFGGLLIVDGKCFELDGSLVPIEVMETIYGLGSGSSYAMGAMACGKTAAEAIVIASRFDPNTNAEVEEVSGDCEAKSKKAKS